MDVGSATRGIDVVRGFRPDGGLRALASDLLGTNAPIALRDGVRDALDGAGMLRARGIEGRRFDAVVRSAGRPAEVIRAGYAFRPDFGDLGPVDVARGRLLVARALEGLDPVVAVNRHPATATPGADGFLPTRVTTSPRTAEDRARRIARAGWERLLGKFGSDGMQGRTVYGSLQFVPREAGGAASFGAFGAARGGYGAARFGSEALQLREAAWQRSTIAARDSGMVPNPPRLAAPEQLADVMLERLARTHGFTQDHVIQRGARRFGVLGEGDDARSLRPHLLHVLREASDEDAIELLRRYQTSTALTDIDHLVEVQVRGVRADDIVARHHEPRAV